MLSMNDLLGYSDLDQSEIEAIAEHEHIPLPIAVELGEQLLGSTKGLRKLHLMVIENMQHAIEQGHHQHADELVTVYHHLQQTHPLPVSAALLRKTSHDARH